jgi:regulatory protein
MPERSARPVPDAEAAMEVAARYLATRPRTRWELERRLRRAGASDEVVAATMERLTAIGQADDLAFARWWADERDRHGPRGRRLLEAELRQRGVPQNVIQELRSAAPNAAAEEREGVPGTEPERARIALERHLRGRPLPDDPKALQRLGMFLVRRGFDPDTARSALRAADKEARTGDESVRGG